MQDTKPEQQLDSNALFKRLCEKLKTKPDYQQRIIAHIRAKHGHSTLPSFHNNGTPEEEKFKTYSECLTAIIKVEKGDKDAWVKLQGQVPAGQAATPSEDKKPAEADSEAKPVNRMAQREKPVKPQPVIEVEASEQTTDKPDPLKTLAGALLPHLTGKTGAGHVDEEQVKRIAESIISEHVVALNEAIAGLKIPGESELKALVEQFIPKPQQVEVRVGDCVRPVSGLTHWQFPQLLTWVAAGIPVWAWGGGGAGKTYLPRQIASALGWRYKVISIDPTITVGKLLGFRNMATGEFVEGFIYEFYKNGGVIAFDEIATGDQGILASTNALIANDEYTFPSGETVQKHENFRVLAMDNTKGAGAVAGYTARNRLDAATLDRFAIIEVEYDTALERALATGLPIKDQKTWTKGESASPETIDRWVTWVQKVRSTVGNSVLVSPRASILGARALRAGISSKEVAEALVFKLVSSDTRQNIVNACGEFSI